VSTVITYNYIVERRGGLAECRSTDRELSIPVFFMYTVVSRCHCNHNHNNNNNNETTLIVGHHHHHHYCYTTNYRVVMVTASAARPSQVQPTISQ
jgi:hypothetical protein